MTPARRRLLFTSTSGLATLLVPHGGRLALAGLGALMSLVLAGVAGCATPPAAPTRPLLRLPPAALGRSLALQQQLLVHAGGQSRRIEVLLEADAESVRLALLNLGQTMARLDWDGRNLSQTSAPGWPGAVSGERVLSDLQLALWPADAIAAALPPDWTLEQRGAQRLLRRSGQVAATVDFPTPTRIDLVDLQHGYRIEIESRPLEVAP